MLGIKWTSKFSLLNPYVEILLHRTEFARFLFTAACGSYEQSTYSCQLIINYASTPFPAGESRF